MNWNIGDSVLLPMDIVRQEGIYVRRCGAYVVGRITDISRGHYNTTPAATRVLRIRYSDYPWAVDWYTTAEIINFTTMSPLEKWVYAR